jgi:hypothetical protein
MGMSGWLFAAAVSLALLASSCRVSTNYRAGPLDLPLAPPPAPPRAAPSTLKAPPPIVVRPLDGDRRLADPEARRSFLAEVGSPSAPLLLAITPPRVTELALGNTILGEAAGMTPTSELRWALVSQGGRASMPVSLDPTECVTFVAQGGLGVIELDLFLTIGQGSAPAVVAEDVDTGPIAVIGGKAGCYLPPMRAAAELYVRVRQGAGVVLVRAFKR